MLVGEKIQFYREIREFTTQELAEKVGITKEDIPNFETGKEEMTVSVMKKIAVVLGIGLTYFMEDDKIEIYPLEKVLENHKQVNYPTSFVDYIKKDRNVMNRILLVDTVDSGRKATKTFLEETYDAVVVEAKTGTEAVALYHEAWKKQKPFDFVIMDFLLYGDDQLDGIDATSYIHKINPSAKVIMTSMMQNELFFIEASRNGVTNFIWKSNSVGIDVKQFLKTPLDNLLHI